MKNLIYLISILFFANITIACRNTGDSNAQGEISQDMLKEPDNIALMFYAGLGSEVIYLVNDSIFHGVVYVPLTDSSNYSRNKPEAKWDTVFNRSARKMNPNEIEIFHNLLSISDSVITPLSKNIIYKDAIEEILYINGKLILREYRMYNNELPIYIQKAITEIEAMADSLYVDKYLF